MDAQNLMDAHEKEGRCLSDLMDSATMLLHCSGKKVKKVSEKTRHCQQDHTQESYKSPRIVSRTSNKSYPDKPPKTLIIPVYPAQYHVHREPCFFIIGIVVLTFVHRSLKFPFLSTAAQAAAGAAARESHCNSIFVECLGLNQNEQVPMQARRVQVLSTAYRTERVELLHAALVFDRNGRSVTEWSRS
jgi:hypothetical protein